MALPAAVLPFLAKVAPYAAPIATSLLDRHLQGRAINRQLEDQNRQDAMQDLLGSLSPRSRMGAGGVAPARPSLARVATQPGGPGELLLQKLLQQILSSGAPDNTSPILSNRPRLQLPTPPYTAPRIMLGR